MRKLSFFLAIGCLALVFSACRQDKKSQDAEAPKGPQMEVSANDTATVRELCEKYLDCLRNSDLDGAIAMLHYLKDGNEIVSLPKPVEERQRMVLRQFLGLKYRMESLIFHKETDCQARYSAELFEKTDDSSVSNKVSFYIKPVRRNGEWYLTMADSESDSTHGSEIEN